MHFSIHKMYCRVHFPHDSSTFSSYIEIQFNLEHYYSDSATTMGAILNQTRQHRFISIYFCLPMTLFFHCGQITLWRSN